MEEGRKEDEEAAAAASLVCFCNGGSCMYLPFLLAGNCFLREGCENF